jgi:hypothetical protein
MRVACSYNTLMRYRRGDRRREERGESIEETKVNREERGERDKRGGRREKKAW